MGHTYDWEDYKGASVDPRLKKIKMSDYDGIWLGGDVCSETGLNPKTLDKLDRLFDLKNPNSHFVLGNHDYRNGNHELFYHATGRPQFYTSSFKNMVVSVLNTNLNSSDCENLNDQFKMLEQVTDTLSKASHYVILMHHQIFPQFDGMKGFKSNGICDYYSMNCHDASSSFENAVYPKLVELENRGVDVLVVVGDSGWHKGSEAVTNAGVDFIASGINNSYRKKDKKTLLKDIAPDKVLHFSLDPKERALSWEFVELNELIGISDAEWYANE